MNTINGLGDGIDFETIKSLLFVQERLPLIDVELDVPETDSVLDRISTLEIYVGLKHPQSEGTKAKAADRTVKVLRLLRDLNAEALAAKEELLFSLHVSSGNVSTGTGQVATFKIPDKARFSALQEIIRDRTSRIAALETAITKLDALGCGFYCDLEKAIGILKCTVRDLKFQVDEMCSFDSKAEALRNCCHMSPEQIDGERTAWDSKKSTLETQLVEATKAFEAQKSRLAEIDSILASVGIVTDPEPLTRQYRFTR